MYLPTWLKKETDEKVKQKYLNLANQQVVQIDLYDYADYTMIHRFARSYLDSNKFSDFYQQDSTNFDKETYKFLWDTAEDVIDKYEEHRFVIVVKVGDLKRLQRFFYENSWLFEDSL